MDGGMCRRIVHTCIDECTDARIHGFRDACILLNIATSYHIHVKHFTEAKKIDCLENNNTNSM